MVRIGVRLGDDEAHGALVAEGPAATGGRVLASATARLDGTPHRALAGLLRELAKHAPGMVRSVTWDVSAALRSALYAPLDRVAALRLQPRAPVSCSLADHPSALVRSLVGWRGSAVGGHDLFGAELAELDADAAVRLAETVAAEGKLPPDAVLAVTATGAVGCADHERAVAERILRNCPRLRVCLSHEFGGIGLLEREAATVLNASLLRVAERLGRRCQRATDALATTGGCWFTTGDGGRMSPERLRAVPVLALAAEGSAGLLGASVLCGQSSALVVLTGPEGTRVGRVRGGLPQVASDLPGPSGVRLAGPQAVLTPAAARSAPATVAALAEHGPESAAVVAVATGVDDGGRAGARALADRIGTDTGRSTILLDGEADPGAVGAACTEPSVWLDLVVTASTADELRRERTAAEQRALTMVTGGGAEPGRERIVESVAYSLAFIRSGTYRLHVRASGAPDPGEDR